MAEEQKLQKKVIDYLTGKNYYVIKIVVCNRNGVPDIFFMKDGRAHFLEIKAPGRKSTTTAIQKYQMMLIKNSGGTVHVIDSLDEVKELYKG